MTTPPTPADIAAAKKGHPDTITAQKVLVTAVTDLEARCRSVRLTAAEEERLERIAGTLWHEDRRWLRELVTRLETGGLVP